MYVVTVLTDHTFQWFHRVFYWFHWHGRKTADWPITRCQRAYSSAFRWPSAGAASSKIVLKYLKSELRVSNIFEDFCPSVPSDYRTECGQSKCKYVSNLNLLFPFFERPSLCYMIFGVVLFCRVHSVLSEARAYFRNVLFLCSRFCYTDDLTQQS